MALTPQNNDAFLREVDEELRREQAAAIFRRWGKIIIAVVVLSLAAFGGWLWWQHYQSTRAAEQGVVLSAALDSLAKGKADEATKPLAELAGSNVDGYRFAAVFTQADIMLARNDLKGAAAKFAAVANDTDQPEAVRNLALLRQTLAEYDTLSPDQVINRLKPMATKESPYFGTAGELTAIALMSMKREAEAGRIFGELAKSEDVSETIRQRAVQMAGLLGVDAIDQSAAQKAEGDAPAAPNQSEEKNAK
ncbi:tetratricopeptide repeat protein [Sphingomonas sp. FW199]|uniref:tetratricopeptide repeat protein n=1 Tax=Sphingomonas sp. FW199 TaxID=3400217 RepID=UPI003CF441EE